MNHHDRDRDHGRPGTPPRPPYSPVTPVFTHLAPVPGFASIGPPASPPSPTTTSFPPTEQYDRGACTTSCATTATKSTTTTPAGAGGVGGMTWTDATFSQRQQQRQQQRQPPVSFIPEPSPVPISESDNPDAIALRSAITILQLQKQQSIRDIRTLEKIKRAAGADPERFAQELASGRLSRHDEGEVGAGFVHFRDEDNGEDEQDEEEEGPQRKSGDEEEKEGSPFGKIPKFQNVIRMPPVNWAKYHIVGESLERLHEEQLKRPFGGEPRRGSSVAGVGAGAGGTETMPGSVSQQQHQQQERAPEYLLAAPYRPLVDKVESQTPSPSKIKVSPSKRGKS